MDIVWRLIKPIWEYLAGAVLLVGAYVTWKRKVQTEARHDTEQKHQQKQAEARNEVRKKATEIKRDRPRDTDDLRNRLRKQATDRED